MNPFDSIYEKTTRDPRNHHGIKLDEDGSLVDGIRLGKVGEHLEPPEMSFSEAEKALENHIPRRPGESDMDYADRVAKFGSQLAEKMINNGMAKWQPTEREEAILMLFDLVSEMAFKGNEASRIQFVTNLIRVWGPGAVAQQILSSIEKHS